MSKPVEMADAELARLGEWFGLAEFRDRYPEAFRDAVVRAAAFRDLMLIGRTALMEPAHVFTVALSRGRR